MSLFNYLLEASISLAIVYLLYHLLFRKLTFFQINRFYLLTGAAFSLILPLLRFDAVAIQSSNLLPMFIVGAADDLTMTSLVMVENKSFFTLNKLMLILYLLGCAIALTYLLIGLFKIARIRYQSSKSPIDNNILLHKQNLAPFTFLSKIYFNEADIISDEILQHETVHIKQKHSIDVLFLEVVSVILWFNPVIYFIKKSIKSCHEYYADKHASKAGDTYTYALKMMEGNTLKQLTFSHSFADGLISMRLKMLAKTKSTKINFMKYLTIVPIVALIVILFACQKQSGEQIIDNTVYTDMSKIDVMPQFKGGQDALMKYLGEKIKYPEEAKGASHEGMVMIGFEIDAGGNIKNAKVVREVSPILDMAALKTIQEMPKWDPGLKDGQPVSVAFTLPIRFQLTDEERSKAALINKDVKVYWGGNSSGKIHIDEIEKLDGFLTVNATGLTVESFDVMAVIKGNKDLIRAENKSNKFSEAQNNILKSLKKGSFVYFDRIKLSDGTEHPSIRFEIIDEVQVTMPKELIDDRKVTYLANFNCGKSNMIKASELHDLKEYNLTAHNLLSQPGTITSFALTLAVKDGDLKIIECMTGKFTKKMEDLLASAKPGDFIYFDKITVDSDILLPALAYKIIEG